MVAFFPWFDVGESFALGSFDLIAWERAAQPAGPRAHRPNGALQQTLDAVLAPFHTPYREPVPRATLLTLNGDDITDDLNDDEREQVFTLAELVAFSGLARREFFSPFGLGPYCNFDNFRLVIQGFAVEPHGTAIGTRRRDGGILAAITADAYREYAPVHVTTNERIRLDVDLLRGLLAATAHAEWPNFDESVFWFNRANTDSQATTAHAEAVMMVGAFERLFDLRHGREQELAQRFVAVFTPTQSRLAGATPRIGGRFDAQMPVREAWVRDFFRLRADPAHGRRDPKYPSVWPVHEHLLLGALAFPLTVKLRLQQLGLYALTAADHDDLELFERFASEDAFAHLQHPLTERPEPAWARVRGELRDERLNAAIQAALAQHGAGDAIM
jgi:hypothetical protein